jgi:hypothetical protein
MGNFLLQHWMAVWFFLTLLLLAAAAADLRRPRRVAPPDLRLDALDLSRWQDRVVWPRRPGGHPEGRPETHAGEGVRFLVAARL